MAEALPEPLVPDHVNLRGYEFMPLYGDVLRLSSLNKRATAEEKWAALNLWWGSWWQTPAASLPNNDLELAPLAGCKTLREWKRVRASAMAKWILCADNRWYHPFLAEKAIAAFKKRKSASDKGTLGAKKRWENNDGGVPQPMPQPRKTDGSAIAPATAPPAKTDSSGNSNRSGSEVISNTGDRNRRGPVDKTPGERKTRAQLTEQKQHDKAKAEPPGGSVADFVKQATGKALKPGNGHAPTDSFEDPDQIPEPQPAVVTTFRLGDDLDPAWRETPDTIDHAGQNLGMVRMAFEDDASYAKRIEARIALDRST